MKNNFEQHIKKSLESFEAEYNPADWSDLQNRLNKAKAGKSSTIGKGLLIAASLISVSGMIYYFSSAEKSNNIPANNTIEQAQNIVAKDENNIPVQQIEIKDEEKHSEKISLIENNNSKKENIPAIINSAEKKTIPVEPRPSASNAENKISVQQQVQNPVEQLPVSNPLAVSAAFRTDINKVCAGDAVQFNVDKNDVSCIYKWSFGDGETSTEQNPKHIFTEAGTYTVKLRVVSSKDKKQAEQKSILTVLSPPSVQLDYSASDDNGLLINFEADAERVVDWKWDFGDKQISSAKTPSHAYKKYGNYKVTVTAKNSSGCMAVITKDLILALNLLAPNGFSPDGNGKNDTWMPVALQNGDYIFTLTVSDKSGNVVFKTSDKNSVWEGQNTKPGDTFIWRAVVKDQNGNESNHQGLITISE